MTHERWRAIATMVSVAALIGSLVALVWVHQWAVGACCGADREAELLIDSTMLACAVLGALAIVGQLTDAAKRSRAAALKTGSAAAFIAVAASAASTLLPAMAISPATDPGDLAGPFFRYAYVGALVLSLCVGVAAVWCGSAGTNGSGTMLALLVMLVMTAAAWGYLAAGSSEVNQCFASDAFPRSTDHLCQGE